VAHQAMIEADLLPDFSKETLIELEKFEKRTIITAVWIFSMIPERLLTHLTSLNLNQERLALVVAGKLVYRFEGLDIGECVRVHLIDTNIEQGVIDLKRIGSPDVFNLSLFRPQRPALFYITIHFPDARYFCSYLAKFFCENQALHPALAKLKPFGMMCLLLIKFNMH